MTYHQDYSRTPNGWLSKCYSSQKHRSKRRGHQPPTYSKQELGQWIEDNHRELFEQMMEDWKQSGYQQRMCPTLDRIDDAIGYTLDNLQLLTQSENSSKPNPLRKTGKPVIGHCLVSRKTLEFESAVAASRHFAKSDSYVKNAIRYKRVCQGYIWTYK